MVYVENRGGSPHRVLLRGSYQWGDPSLARFICDFRSLIVGSSVVASVRLCTFSGAHREMGVQQGQALRGLIHEGWDQIPSFDFVKLMKPRLLPSSIFMALAKRRAAKMLGDDIFQLYPKQAQRLKGIAEGAEFDLSTLLFMQSMELLIGTPSYRLQACTALAFGPQRTSTKETCVAKNFDYPNELSPYHLTCRTEPEKGYRTLGCSMAPLPGVLDGMNEHGLTVTYNIANTNDKPENHVPLSIALQEMLETCKTTDEATRFITHAKRGGHDALLMLADAEGSLKAVEITSRHFAIREAEDGKIIHANHFLTAEMQQYEIPHEAVYFGKTVPQELIGVRIHESSEQRLKRAQELLRGKPKVDENMITAVLRDHGEDDKPSRLTICRHDKFGSTLRSVIFYPNRKTIKVSYGNPCQNEYAEFKLPD